jgi:muramidase (phage lysozyme)
MDNRQAFLALLRKTEGTDKYANPYTTGFGGVQLDNLNDHPHKILGHTADGNTTAAGAYQFLGSTWDGIKNKLGLKDFSPQSQDAAALELIRQKGALGDIDNGNFQSAIQKLGSTWASLPSSPYLQGHRSNEDVQKMLQQITGGRFIGQQPFKLPNGMTAQNSDEGTGDKSYLAALNNGETDTGTPQNIQVPSQQPYSMPQQYGAMQQNEQDEEALQPVQPYRLA